MILFLHDVQIINVSFTADNTQKKCNEKHVPLEDKILVRKIMFYS